MPNALIGETSQTDGARTNSSGGSSRIGWPRGSAAPVSPSLHLFAPLQLYKINKHHRMLFSVKTTPRAGLMLINSAQNSVFALLPRASGLKLFASQMKFEKVGGLLDW